MDFDKLFPIIIIMIIWGINAAIRKSPKDDQVEPSPAGQIPSLLKVLREGIAVQEEKKQRAKVINLDEYIKPVSAVKQPEMEKKSELLVARVESSAVLESIKIRKGRRRKLQNAVVWAEILAPPVAFRD
ncbi:MAG: hypothetical protein KKB30_09325 [Proteobacteria bacterium]|nr:hypothetical protein [Pseudomonadota bacterium]MBU1714123.1 hypothetical protein [Pseudomonadota bacterium]